MPKIQAVKVVSLVMNHPVVVFVVFVHIRATIFPFVGLFYRIMAIREELLLNLASSGVRAELGVGEIEVGHGRNGDDG